MKVKLRYASCIFCICFLLVGFANHAQADLIYNTGWTDDRGFLFDLIGNKPTSADFVSLLGTSTDPYVLLDKDIGEFLPGLEDRFLVDDWDNQDDIEASVWWNLTGTDYKALAVVVKDGNANQSGEQWCYYLIDEEQYLTSGDILLDGSWEVINTLANGAGGISHVELWGVYTGDDEPPQLIPEPATMLLLGSGLIGLAGLGRRKRKK